jgi:hypothetical protein
MLFGVGKGPGLVLWTLVAGLLCLLSRSRTIYILGVTVREVGLAFDTCWEMAIIQFLMAVA